MLDALLQTIGTLAVLASIAAKIVYFRSAPRAGEDAAADGCADSASGTDGANGIDGADSAIGSRPMPGSRRGAGLNARCKR